MNGYEVNYKKWLLHPFPFTFCGLGLMLRKSSIPLIGLFNTNIVRIDYEFGMRVTSGRINLAWYTGNSYVRVSNPSSNSVTMSDKMIEEEIKLNNFYLDLLPESKTSGVVQIVQVPHLLKDNLRKLIRVFKNKLKYNKNQNEAIQGV